MLSYFTIGLTICRLATCAGAISANFQSMKTNSTTLGSETSLKMMMVVGVLNFAVLQIVPPNSYPTIPGTLAVKGQVCSVDASCHSLEYSGTCVYLFDLGRFDNSFFVSRYPGLCHNGPACLFSSRLRKWSRFTYLSLFRSARCGPSSWSTRPDQLWTSWDCLQAASLCHLSQIEVNPLSPFAALRNASRALWWCCCHGFGPHLLPLVTIIDVR